MVAPSLCAGENTLQEQLATLESHDCWATWKMFGYLAAGPKKEGIPSFEVRAKIILYDSKCASAIIEAGWNWDLGNWISLGEPQFVIAGDAESLQCGRRCADRALHSLDRAKVGVAYHFRHRDFSV
jgi:hypothetical protein